MKDWKHLKDARHASRRALPGGAFVAVFIGLVGAIGCGTSNAQSTSGHIFGQAPAGVAVTAHNATGLRRHVIVKSSGRYNITALPAGIYTVVLEKDGAVVDTRQNIPLAASRGAEVDFACPKDVCAAP